MNPETRSTAPLDVVQRATVDPKALAALVAELRRDRALQPAYALHQELRRHGEPEHIGGGAPPPGCVHLTWVGAEDVANFFSDRAPGPPAIEVDAFVALGALRLAPADADPWLVLRQARVEPRFLLPARSDEERGLMPAGLERATLEVPETLSFRARSALDFIYFPRPAEAREVPLDEVRAAAVEALRGYRGLVHVFERQAVERFLREVGHPSAPKESP